MADAGQDEAPARLGALDGVRGVALVAVVAFHAFPDLVPGGFFGVEAFFVLSGFLLASLLLGEHDRTGSIDVLAFAGRRLRRIVPALWLLLAVLVVVAPVVASADAHRLRPDILWSAGGLTNWHLVLDQSSYFNQLGRPPLVRHLWSIAVEVQFYVICPFLVLWAARRPRRHAMAGLAGGIALSVVLLGVLGRGADPSRAYYGTDTRIGALLSGVLLALVLREVLAQRGAPAPLSSPAAAGETAAGETAGRRRSPVAGGDPYADLLAAVGAAVLILLFWRAREGQPALYPLGFVAVQAATAAMIAGVVLGTGARTVLGIQPLRWLGERSYGIYLWHWPLVALLRPGIDVGWPAAVTGVVGIAGALALGHASYVLVELPLLGRRRSPIRLPEVNRPAAVACAALLIAGVVGIVVNLPSKDPIAETIRAGEELLSSQGLADARPAVVPAPPPTTAPPAPPTTVRAGGPKATVRPATTATTARVRAPPPPARPPPAPVAMPAGPPPGAVAVTAIGDSVMLSAAGPLKARLGPNSAIDAKVSRQFREGVGVVAQLRQQGRLAPVVLVHLGTNGPPTGSDVDAMVGAAGGARVLFLNVRVGRSWTAETNRVLAEASTRHPNATLVDWFAHSEGQGDWFQSDGTHLTARGAEAYATLVGSGLPAAAPTG